MTNAESRFEYVTYIRSKPNELWKAITTPELMRQYWFGYHIATDWKAGSPWKLVKPDGALVVSGTIVEVDHPHRGVLTWRDECRPELTAEGDARWLIEIEPEGEATKLTITHSIEVANSKLIALVSRSWPRVLSNLKSLLETSEIETFLHAPSVKHPCRRNPPRVTSFVAGERQQRPAR
jgi:uncharacterized protein YndB with AHSA1/START domain